MAIYFDACIAIYLVEEHPVYAPIVEARLRGCAAGIAYSPLVELECLVLPIRQQRTELVKRFHGFFALNRRLALNDEIFRMATELRARHGIKTPDALHLAAAMHHGCPEFWTNDDRLRKVAGSMAINVLTAAVP
ncbi:MAG: type II toxin-antitoxin system VapC family toxin [Sulfurisoma sp.]|nr:type II toxin-antitoxin system VapC family toxin [Sulfurisoma sp.]